MVFVNIIVILVIVDCKQKLYSHLLITRLISLFDMTPTPHPIQRCSTGKKRVIQGYPGSIFHSQAFLLKQRMSPGVVESIKK